MGYLKLTRVKSAAHAFDLKVEKMTINAGPIIHQTAATLKCRDDALASLLQWDYSSSFLDTAFCPREDLAVIEWGEAAGDELLIWRGHRPRRATVKTPLIAGWALLDVLQRGGHVHPDFTYFDDLRHLKERHLLNGLAQPPLRVCGGRLKVRGVYQLGQGIAPTEYWLDEASRVVAICSNSICHVFDERAKEKAWQTAEELLQGGIHYEY